MHLFICKVNVGPQCVELQIRLLFQTRLSKFEIQPHSELLTWGEEKSQVDDTSNTFSHALINTYLFEKKHELTKVFVWFSVAPSNEDILLWNHHLNQFMTSFRVTDTPGKTIWLISSIN